MPLIKQFAHVCLGATDLQKSTHFYCTALGLKKKFRFMRDGKEFGFYLDLGGNTFIEIFEQTALELNEQNPIKHFCLQVDDIDKVIAALRANGYDVSDKQLGADQSWQCWTTDPHGARIEMHQYTVESTQTTGHDCVINSTATKK
jgi:lactoylglutathione lyase/glyoxylase I family protein